MWKKVYSFLVSPFSEANSLISLSLKFQKYIWDFFPWRIIRLFTYSILSGLFAYAWQAAVGLLVNKLVQATKSWAITLTMVMPYFIALLAALILPRALNVLKNYHEMEDWRVFDLWWEQTMNRKTAELDFAYHDDSTIVSLARKIRDNLYRIRNFYSRPTNMLEWVVWLIAALICKT
jgi:hypothetical protein